MHAVGPLQHNLNFLISQRRLHLQPDLCGWVAAACCLFGCRSGTVHHITAAGQRISLPETTRERSTDNRRITSDEGCIVTTYNFIELFQFLSDWEGGGGQRWRMMCAGVHICLLLILHEGKFKPWFSFIFFFFSLIYTAASWSKHFAYFSPLLYQGTTTLFPGFLYLFFLKVNTLGERLLVQRATATPSASQWVILSQVSTDWNKRNYNAPVINLCFQWSIYSMGIYRAL